jgi:hypothetical protein
VTGTDLELLRRYEPIIRYTHGEYFFPMTADDYVAQCDLWGIDAEGERSLLVPAGALSIDDLASWTSAARDQALFLRFVQKPLTGKALTQGRQRAGRPRFSAPSRLARVGVLARLIDAGFDLSLLVRGTVPGGTVAAAEVKYAAIREANPAFTYYGRVVRHAGWTVCQYLFFYAMNDWRSSFSGANDHEADWEQCFVFVEEGDAGTSTPVWFARAAHDEVGADLRRRWDDPLLRREGDHPVIFAGAGSHAAYVEQGEYLLSVPVRLPARIRAFMGAVWHFWTETLGQGQGGRGAALASIPFVDYARGDGLAIGPGQPNGWTPVLIDDAKPWVRGFDGLFGLDTEDRMAGERAPAGPRWARDGRPRQSWVDPIAFAGLDATPPPGRAVQALTAEIEELGAELERNRASITDLERTAQRLGVRVAAAERAGRSEAFVRVVTAERDETVDKLRALRRRADGVASAIGDSNVALERIRAGDMGDPRTHLRHVVHPQDPAEIRRGRVLDVWSAMSVALAILLLGGLLITNVAPWWTGLIVVAIGYVVIEALVRRRVLVLLLNLTILLAVVASLILLWTHFALAVAASLLAIGFMILKDNLGELIRARG